MRPFNDVEGHYICEKMAQSLFHKIEKEKQRIKLLLQKLQIVYLLRLNNLNISSRTSRKEYTFISPTTFVYYTMRNKKKGLRLIFETKEDTGISLRASSLLAIYRTLRLEFRLQTNTYAAQVLG